MKRKPKIGICAANKMGNQIVSFLAKEGYEVKFIATCERDESGFEDKIIKSANKLTHNIFRRINTENQKFIDFLYKEKIDLIILAWWPSIVKENSIGLVKVGWLNMHPSLLPFGRGKHPYYWTIVEETPFGASLHLINKNIDSGPIIYQKEIPYSFSDTGESLYQKGYQALYELFTDNCKEIMGLKFTAKKQDDSKSTFHLSKQLDINSEIKPNKKYLAKDLINIIRARTFMEGESAFMYVDRKKYYLKLIIKEA